MSTEEYWSAQQLSVAFGFRNGAEVLQALIGIEPIGENKGTGKRVPVWRLRDAAPYLVKLTAEQVESRIRDMNEKQIPAKLTREYWFGQMAMLKVKQVEGDLWPTKDIVAIFGDALKTIRMGLLLIPDKLERSAGLTLAQRAVIDREVTSILEGVKSQLGTSFNESKQRAAARASDATSAKDPDEEDEF